MDFYFKFDEYTKIPILIWQPFKNTFPVITNKQEKSLVKRCGLYYVWDENAQLNTLNMLGHLSFFPI